MDFEKVLTILVFFAGVAGIILGMTTGILALRRRMAKDRLELEQIGAGAWQEELDDLRLRVEELERRGLTSGEVLAESSRLTELEERLDFAERLLAQREVPLRLPGDGGMS